MKFSHILAAVTLLLATLAFHVEASASFHKPTDTYRGQVIEVHQDDEGASIVIRTKNGVIHTVYAPRSRANEEIIQRAVKARETKTAFTITTQNI